MSVDTQMHCARHPKEVTGVSCASCGTPICTRCMVATPVGMKCPSCARGKLTALTQIRPERVPLTIIVALAAGAGAALINLIVSFIGFILIFASVAYGYFAGNMILKASGMKRGMKMEIITGVGMVVGGVGFRLFPVLPALVHGNALPILIGQLADLWFWLAIGIATSCGISKIRYM